MKRLVLLIACSALCLHAKGEGEENPAYRFMEMRERTLNKVREEQARKEATPEYQEEQRKLAAERDKALQAVKEEALKKLRDVFLLVQARAITVRKGAILAAIRVKTTVSGGKKGKPKYSLGPERDQLVWIEGVDTRNVVDGDKLDLKVYPAGKHSYEAVDGSLRTVHRFHTSPEQALDLTLSQE